MNTYILYLLAFTGGVFLAIQGALNSHLGVLLKNPLLASAVAFISSSLLAILLIIFSVKTVPSTTLLKEVPIYLWFTGGIFSLMGICLYYYTIPKLGVSTMMSLGLCGQLTIAIIAGHNGWLNLPVEPISLKRFTGLLAMVIGIYLINTK